MPTLYVYQRFSTNFDGAKKCEIGPRFSTTLAFEPQSFRKGATYMKSKGITLSFDDEPTSSQSWCSSVYAPLS